MVNKDMPHTQVDFLKEFVNVQPFHPQLMPLPPTVDSDHVRIRFHTPHGDVVSENVCNTDVDVKGNEAFRNTRLFEDIGNMNKSRARIKNQTARIVAEMINENLLAYIVVGASEYFEREMMNEWKMLKEGEAPFKLVFANNCISGKKARMCVLESKRLHCDMDVIESDEYITDTATKQTMHMISMVFKDNTEPKITLIAVHVPACITYYPRSALHALAKRVQEFREKVKGVKDIPLLVMGDFNTVPYTIQQEFLSKFENDALLLPISYPTHVTANCKAVQFDHVVWIQSKSSKPWFKQIISAEDKQPIHCTDLINATCNARKYHLDIMTSRLMLPSNMTFDQRI